MTVSPVSSLLLTTWMPANDSSLLGAGALSCRSMPDGSRVRISDDCRTALTGAPAAVIRTIGSWAPAAIEASGIFCINTLPAHGVETAEIFASRRGLQGEERFAADRWTELVTGAPALLDALAAFDCRLVSVHDIASHRVLIGEVVGLGGRAPENDLGGSLIYRRRRFEAV